MDGSFLPTERVFPDIRKPVTGQETERGACLRHPFSGSFNIKE